MKSSTSAAIAPERTQDMGGLILCGGAARRLGGAEKAWLLLGGRPLLAHALERLAPQVRTVALSANRALDRYQALGLAVWPDEWPGLPGPLAGWATALGRCETPWLLAVPCDAPRLPPDLGSRLADALRAATTATGITPPLAVASAPDADGRPQIQPVFALLHRRLKPALMAALAAGEHRVGRFALQQGAAVAFFDDAGAFANLNSPDDWAMLGAVPAEAARR